MRAAFRHAEMTGSDNRMDQRGDMLAPVNRLPVGCSHCTFPDLDFVAQPYLLAKGTSNPNDIQLAEVGNFFVRDRARNILEAVVPGQCAFYSTLEMRKKTETPWYLAVPTKVIQTATVKPSVPRCPQCGEPKVSHPGAHYIYADAPQNQRWEVMAAAVRGTVGSVACDIFKSLNWSSSERTAEEQLPSSMRKSPVDPNRWTRQFLGRELFFSLRLYTLLTESKVKGLYRLAGYDTEPLNDEEKAWVRSMYERLGGSGLTGAPGPPKSTGIDKWFRSYLKKHAKELAPVDFAVFESANQVLLPDAYKEFISTVGVQTYHDVDDEEGFTVHILSPENLGVDLRKGSSLILDEESQKVDGIAFASTDHFDRFCFDASAGADYPVFHFNGETFLFEAYAANFKECIRRFAGG
jgi:hypothetical protein